MPQYASPVGMGPAEGAEQEENQKIVQLFAAEQW